MLSFIVRKADSPVGRPTMGSGRGATRSSLASAAAITKTSGSSTISLERSPRSSFFLEAGTVEKPGRSKSPGLAGLSPERPACDMERCPLDSPRKSRLRLGEPIRFDHPDFAMTLRMENSNNGISRFFYSYDRGKNWRGPFRLPLFDQKGVMARTDYVVDGAKKCTLFLTASKTNGREGRPFCARTVDGGLTWQFLSFIGPEPAGYAIMPSSVRLSPGDLVTTIRRQDLPRSWIDAYRSRDDGLTWTLLSTPEADTGEGNPPSLVRLPDERLCLIYGSRRQPLGIYARLSADDGKTWGKALALRDDAGGRDIGYVRSIVRPDGKVVAVYYYHDRTGPTRYLAATIWAPGKP